MALSCFKCFKGNTKINPKPVEQAAGDQQLVNSAAPKKRPHVDFSLPVPRSSLDVTPAEQRKAAARDTGALAKQLANLLHLQVDPERLIAAEDFQGASTPGGVPVGLRAFSRHAPDDDSKLQDDPIQLATLSGHPGEQQNLSTPQIAADKFTCPALVADTETLANLGTG